MKRDIKCKSRNLKTKINIDIMTTIQYETPYQQNICNIQHELKKFIDSH